MYHILCMEEAMKVYVKSFLFLGIISCGTPIFASSTENKPASQQVMPSLMEPQSVTVPARVFNALMAISSPKSDLNIGDRNNLTPEQIEAAEKRVFSEQLAIIKSYINDPNTILNAPVEFAGNRHPFLQYLMYAMSDAAPELDAIVETLLNNKDVVVTSGMLFYTVAKNKPELFEILRKRGVQPDESTVDDIKAQIKFLRTQKGAIEKETLAQWRDILKKLQKGTKENTSTSTSSSSSSSQKSSSSSASK